MNLKNMLLGSDLAAKQGSIKKLFFYRICGTGMGACACLAREAGFEVAGADMSFSPPMDGYLKSLDIPLYKLDELTKDILAEYDLVIVGNSVPRMSEHARFVEECGVAFTSFPSFLGEFILKDKEVIGLAGTHGKTTTTYFLTQMLESLGEDVGYFIGGIVEGRAPSHLGKSKYFLIESDEYDSCYFQKISKFRLYELNHMIITSLEFDHADIFNSIEDIKNEFSESLKSIDGNIIANDAYVPIYELKEKFESQNKWTMYGDEKSDSIRNIKSTSLATSFEVVYQEELIPFETDIIGNHNIYNISSCILLLLELGFDKVDIQNSVKNLGLVKRRQEYRGIYNDSIVIDDFAHHPRAIELTTQAIRSKYPDKKIVTVFEPISATARSSVFQKEFMQSLSKSDVVILAQNPLSTTVKDAKNLDCEQIVSELNHLGIQSHLVQELELLRAKLNDYAGAENLLLILSNRTCLGLWESDFVKKLL